MNSKNTINSGLWVLLGLVFLHLSQSIFFVGGNIARLGSLLLGFCMILMAAFLRVRNFRRLYKHAGFFLLSGGYFSILIVLTYFQEHEIWNDPVTKVFVLVCIFLFWAGYILAREKRHAFQLENHWALVGVAGVSIICLLAFLRFVKGISLEGTERGYGDIALNPVGVAYANTCLALLFFVQGMFSKIAWRKSVFFSAGIFGCFVVLSSVSRGAIIWGAGAIIFFLLMTRGGNKFSKKRVRSSFFVFLAVIPLIFILYKTNYAISEQIDLLLGRFSALAESISRSGAGDMSVTIRQDMWNQYLTSVEKWILFGQHGYAVYPHNQWLEILVSFGLLGVPLLLMSIVLFFRLCWDSLKKRMYPDLEFALIATLFVYGYLQSMSSLSLYMNRVLWLGFGYLLGLYMEQAKIRKMMRQTARASCNQALVTSV